MEDLSQYKENPKTTYLVSVYEDLLRQIGEMNSMKEKDPSMVELAEEELKNLKNETNIFLLFVFVASVLFCSIFKCHQIIFFSSICHA